MEPEYHELDPDGDVVLNLQKNHKPLFLFGNVQSKSPSDVAERVTIARMRMSSKHLSLASLYFRNMFKSNWKEGKQLEDNGKIQIYEEGSEVKPLLALMNIIHGRSSQIPRSVDLLMLTSITTLVDYYKCTEAVAFFAELWITYLQPQLPQEYTYQAIQWLWIAYTFNKPTIFKSITRTIIEGLLTPLSMAAYPIPQNIIS